MLSFEFVSREGKTLQVGYFVHRLPRLGLCLLPALSLAGCGTASLPKLSDLTEGGPPPTIAAAPSGNATPPLSQLPPPVGAIGSAAPPGSPPGAGAGPAIGAEKHRFRGAREQDLIVGFKGPTVILFGGEFGNEGERVAASAINVPIQARSAASNASRVQIETAQGPRWVARSEITLGALERGVPSPR